MQHVLEVKQDDINSFSFSGSSSSTRKYFACKPLLEYRDLDSIELILRVSSGYLVGGIRLKKFPEWLQRVVLIYKVNLIDKNDQIVSNIGGSGVRGFIFDDGRGEGMGPWGMSPGDYGETFSWSGIGKYLFGGKFRIGLQITKYTPTYDDGPLLHRLAEVIYTGHEKSKMELLEKEKEQLMEQNEKLNDQLQDLKRSHQEEKSTLERQTQLNERYSEEIEQLTEQNLQYKDEAQKLKEQIKVIQEKLDQCQPEAALQKLVPDKIRLDGYDTTGKKELLLNLLALQNLVMTEIMKGEKCTGCQKTSRTQAVTPCGHLAYCQTCFTQEEQAASDNERPMKCPVCSESVTAGIVVQQ